MRRLSSLDKLVRISTGTAQIAIQLAALLKNFRAR